MAIHSLSRFTDVDSRCGALHPRAAVLTIRHEDSVTASPQLFRAAVRCAQRAVHVTEEYAAMAPEEIQVLADAKEADAAARYRRRQQFSALVADAIRRAEAMTRLEIQLTRPAR